MEEKICNCGRPAHYKHGDEYSCNKMFICPTYDNLSKLVIQSHLGLIKIYAATNHITEVLNKNSILKVMDKELLIQNDIKKIRNCIEEIIKQPDYVLETLEEIRSGS